MADRATIYIAGGALAGAFYGSIGMSDADAPHHLWLPFIVIFAVLGACLTAYIITRKTP
jgi:hypothetical protein